MYAILAEDKSDAEALKVIIRKHLKNSAITVKTKGYGGCAPLRRKGAKDIQYWATEGVVHFVVCHDADANSPEDIRKAVTDKVLTPSGFADKCCIVVPVQEIEAWLIADETAICNVIPSFAFEGHPNPESIVSPKEWLVRKSRAANGKPLYSPATFNPEVAKHIRLDVVARKCASFRAFIASLPSPSE